MNNKPDEATLIAYLYGELDGVELTKVEAYLLDNPEEKKRLEDWSFARSALQHLEDKEVIAPPIFLGEEKASLPIWRERYFRLSLGMAASLLLFLVAARLMGLSATYSQGELKIGFGVKAGTPSLTEQEVGNLIQSSVAKNNEVLQAAWKEDRQSLAQSIQSDLNTNSTKIDRFMQTATEANQDQVRKFVGQLQDDNLKLMKDYMQLSAAGQKEYIETILVDFSKYLQEQRKQDLEFVQTRMYQVEKNTDQLKSDTEQLLTSLITNKSAINQKKN